MENKQSLLYEKNENPGCILALFDNTEIGSPGTRV